MKCVNSDTKRNAYDWWKLTANRIVITFGVIFVLLGSIGEAQPRVVAQDSGIQSAKGKHTFRQIKQRQVSLSVRDSSLAYVLRALTNQAGIGLVFNLNDARFKRRITLRVQNADVEAAVAKALEGTGLVATFASNEQMIVVRSKQDADVQNASSQGNGVIHVRVIDSASGQYIAGASVTIVGTKVSGVTNGKGEVQLSNVPTGAQTLVIKLFGYKSLTRVVNVNKSTPVNFVGSLASIPTTLSGVVTTATGVQRKLEVGNDITTINADSIMKTMPVTSLSDLLVTRVPGMNVALTSGTPGAPSKIRIRGLSSVTGTNDPILIVDGVRVYSAQGNTGRVPLTGADKFMGGGGIDRSTNMALGTTTAMPEGALVSSPLDQIDPNSIATIDILKGPSAVALYGTDATNGVIVVTTKRGISGPPQWSLSLSIGTETMPGTWPNNYYMMGTMHDLDGTINPGQQCLIASAVMGTCTQDSLLIYQILNDPKTTVFGRGNSQTYRAEVRGGTGRSGNSGLRYALTGSATRNLGLLKMPDIDVALLRSSQVIVPDWQRRPQAAEQQSGSSRLDVTVTPTIEASLTNGVTRGVTRTTPLQAALGTAATLPPAMESLIEGQHSTGSGLLQNIKDFRKRIHTQKVSIRNTVDLIVTPRSWLTANATAGFGYETRRDLSTIDRADCVGCTGESALGEYNTAQGTAGSTSLNLRVSGQHAIHRLLSLRTSLGGNFERSTSNDLMRFASDLPSGATSGNQAGTISTREQVGDRSTAGLYLETTFGIANRFYLPLAIRQDVGSGIGSRTPPRFPKLSFSYVLSDHEWFRTRPLLAQFNSLRLRSAYGQSGVQPPLEVKLRGYEEGSRQFDGISITTASIGRYGNPEVRPERTQEFEGGLDLGWHNDAISLSITGYSKLTKDALIDIPLPPSLGLAHSMGTMMNVGRVRNMGLEVALNARVLDISSLSWQINTNITRNRNTLVDFAQGSDNTMIQFASGSRQRFVEGYPLYGRWARRVIGYSILERNGIRTVTDVTLSDSSIYLGGPLPNYQMGIQSDITLLTRLSVSVNLNYENGKNQVSTALARSLSRAVNDPETPLPMQAYQSVLARTDIGVAQTVSVLRFDALSVRYAIPPGITRRIFSGRQVSFALQGRNLGLKTNYRGKDPNVSSTMSEVFRDHGALPRGRSWELNLRIN